MEQLSERLQTPISTAELERRWKAVRAAMERDKIDVLLMQNNSDQMGGYVKYFTDLPATNGYPLTVVFPRDDLMTLVSQGPFGGVTELNGKSDGTRRGVKQWFTTPSYASCYYTAPYDPELAAKALEPYAGGTIGLVGTYQMSFAMVDYMQKGRFSNTKFVDASDLVDRIKVIKSAEEQDLVRRAAAMQDGAMRAAFAAVEPGMRDRDVAAIAQYLEVRVGLGLEVVERDVGCELDQRQAAAVAVEREHAEIGDHHIDDAGAGQRQRASLLQLRIALGGMLHDDDDFLDAADEIHGAAHAFDHLAGDHPIGEVAVFRHLHGAEDGDIDVTAADHGERVSRIEIARGRQLGDGLLAGIDEIGIFLTLEREWPGAEHAVLRLQLHTHAVGNVIRHQGGNTDAEIDVKTVAQLFRGAFGHLIATPGHHTSPPVPAGASAV